MSSADVRRLGRAFLVSRQGVRPERLKLDFDAHGYRKAESVAPPETDYSIRSPWPRVAGNLRRLLPTQPAARNKVSITSRGHPRLPAPLRTRENKALIAGTLDVPAESMFSDVPRLAVIVGK